MKLLIVNHVYIDELCATTQLEIVNSLNKLGIDTQLIIPADKKLSKHSKIKAVNVYSRNSFVSSPIFNLKLFFTLPFKIHNEKTNILMLDHLAFFGSLSSILLTKIGLINTKFIFDVRSQPVSTIGLIGKLRVIQFSLAMRISKYVINDYTFLTPMMADEQTKRYKINDKTIGYWGCGVDANKFSPELYKKQAEILRNKLNLKNDYIVFYHGAIAHNRGLDKAVKAMVCIDNKLPIKLILLGSGSECENLKKLIIKYNLQEQVTILPSVPRDVVPEYIEMSDLAIIPLPNHPDWRAQQPIKLSEYISMGKPIIATNIPAHTKILDHLKLGIIIPNNNPKIIATAINKAYENRNNFTMMANEDRQFVLDKLTWDSIAESLIEYFEAIR